MSDDGELIRGLEKLMAVGPSFDEAALKGAVARYHREYDRYLKLCARVAEICRLEIVEGNAIRAQVTSRAKTPKSFESKLRGIVEKKKKPLTDIESVFAHVRDLAAVRIATYEAQDESRVVQHVAKRFHSEVGTPPSPEPKDYERERPGENNYYRATHVEVFLPPADIVGTYANVVGVPCEIQVCSMMAHVWNEIEHDLAYKPYSGSLSTFERDQLRNLGMNVRMADSIISQLLEATNKRQAAETTPFADVYDFVARLRPWFPGVDFGKHAGALFETLRPLRLLTPEAIRRQIDLPDPIAAGAHERGEFLIDNDLDLLELLDFNSSDLLLLAIIPKLGKVLARRQADEHPLGRIQTIASLAVLYLPSASATAKPDA